VGLVLPLPDASARNYRMHVWFQGPCGTMEHIRESAAEAVDSTFPFGASSFDHRRTRQRAAGFDVSSAVERVSQLGIIHRSLLVV